MARTGHPETFDPFEPGFLSTELANTVTHAVGCAASVAGLALLVVMSSLRGGARNIVACSVYGVTLVLLYLASTLYHATLNRRARKVLQVIDHAAIYLLIAGTYTPFALITLAGGWGWVVFGVIWGLAIIGIVQESIFIGRHHVLSLILYLAMGWMSLFLIKPLLANLPPLGLFWLVAGGVAYTTGVIFYVWTRFPNHHAIWHLFVMAGSTCHFFAIMFYVLPGS